MKSQKGELIEFWTKDGAQLHGFLVRKSPRDIIIFVHGMGSNFYRGAPTAFAKEFSKKGLSTFVLNTRGHDLISKTHFGDIKTGKRKVIGTSLEKFKDSLNDIRAAIDTISKLKFKNIYLAGHSTGCQKTTYYLYKTHDRRIKSLILLSPTDDYAHFKRLLGHKWKKLNILAQKEIKAGRGDKLLKSFPGLMSAKRFLSDTDLKHIEARILNYDSNLREFRKIKTPILGIFGTADESFVKKPLEIIRFLEKSLNFTGETIVGGDHSFVGREKEIAAKSIKWLNSLRKRD